MYNLDVKMAYQVLRLLCYLEQILTVGDIDLRRDKEEWKAMKRGEWGSKEKFLSEFDKRMRYVEDLMKKSDLPDQPRKDELRNLLDGFIKEYYEKEDVIKTEYVSAKDVMEKLHAIEKKLDKSSD